MSRAHPLRVTDYLQHILEAIGEACNNIAKNHPDFAAQHAAVPWGFAYEMRNAQAHGYFTVDLAIVWQTILNDLPTLQRQVSALQI
nr:HepT-like ribonuclease domain-containing protein [Rhodoferax sp.]